MIIAETLTKSFGKKQVLTGLSLSVKDGSVYGLVGTNSAGKTTLLRILSGILKSEKGSVQYDGKELFDNYDVKKDIFFVPDDVFFERNATVLSSAKLFAQFYSSFDMKYFENGLEALNISPDSMISSLSKGVKRQVSLLIALSSNCRYLLFDETFDGLDPIVRSHFRHLICEYVAETDRSVILTSHSIRELDDMCDCMGMLFDGKIVFESDIETAKSSFCKIQLVLPEEDISSALEGLEILGRSKSGIVTTLFIFADTDTVQSRFSPYEPKLLDILPLTLEEVFISQMEVRGYVVR